MNNIRLLFKKVFKIIKLLFLIVKFCINYTFKILDRIIENIVNRLRFSISFKITATYVFIFVLIFFFMTIGIFVTFNYYIENGSKGNYLQILSGILAGFNIVGIIMVIFIGSRASRRLMSPVETMTKTVKEISINELDTRLDVSGSKDELKDLAKTFNDMMDRIQVSVNQQTQFVSDASHELRTPISVIQGYANLLDRWGKDDKKILEESISAIKSESENMKELVEKLLFLARSDKNTQRLEKQNFMLNEVIDLVIKETKMIDTTHNLISEQNENFIIYADKKLIKEAIRIFMDNSVKYTPYGGIIKLNSYKIDNKAVINIEDTGVGIPEEDIPHIFDRFYRSDKSRTKQSGGTGLGLSIAKWIIDNHNGMIYIQSKIDCGTSIKIELPI